MTKRSRVLGTTRYKDRAGKRRVRTPSGCHVWVDDDQKPLDADAPLPEPSFDPRLTPDADAELTPDERLAMEIAACVPPFTPEISKALMVAAGLSIEHFMRTIVKHHTGTAIDDLDELGIRMLHVRLGIIRAQHKGRMTAKQAAEWGFKPEDAAAEFAAYDTAREEYKR